MHCDISKCIFLAQQKKRKRHARRFRLFNFFSYNFTFQQLFVDVVGSRIRLVAALESIENLRGICKAGIKFQIEIEGQRKPALEGVATFLYYFV